MNRLIRDCVQIARRTLAHHPYTLSNKHHYSFIIVKGKIIEWATNYAGEPQIKFGYHPRSSVHSEFMAYKRARGLLRPNEPFTVINMRFNRKGKLMNSKPCSCCCAFLKHQGCHSIWFSTDNDEIFLRL